LYSRFFKWSVRLGSLRELKLRKFIKFERDFSLKVCFLEFQISDKALYSGCFLWFTIKNSLRHNNFSPSPSHIHHIVGLKDDTAMAWKARHACSHIHHIAGWKDFDRAIRQWRERHACRLQAKQSFTVFGVTDKTNETLRWERFLSTTASSFLSYFIIWINSL